MENTVHTTQNSSIQSKNNQPTWTWPVHSGLAVKTKPQGKDDYILDIKINIDAIHTTHTPNCMIIQEIQQTIIEGDGLQQLREHIIKSWPQSRNKVLQEIRFYSTFKDDMAVIDGIRLKGRWIVIPKEPQKKRVDQLHNNHIGFKKMKLLACKPTY